MVRKVVSPDAVATLVPDALPGAALVTETTPSVSVPFAVAVLTVAGPLVPPGINVDAPFGTEAVPVAVDAPVTLGVEAEAEPFAELDADSGQGEVAVPGPVAIGSLMALLAPLSLSEDLAGAALLLPLADLDGAALVPEDLAVTTLLAVPVGVAEVAVNDPGFASLVLAEAVNVPVSAPLVLEGVAADVAAPSAFVLPEVLAPLLGT